MRGSVSRRGVGETTALVVLLTAGAACQRAGESAASPTSSASSAPSTPPPAAAPPPPNAVSVLIAYGSEKKSWLEEQIASFNASGAKLASGAPVTVVGRAMGSGEAVEEILAGRLRPTVFSPASGVYASLLNDRWLAAGGHATSLVTVGEPLVLSPVVIALWRPMASALGWPARRLGWSDIIAASQNPAGWASKGRAEWGEFKLGHTHPEYSSSGLLAVLAEAYAGAKKTRGLSAKDLAAPKTQKFVGAIETAIVHYGKSTGFFAEKMRARGPSYLSAAVLYENLVIESYGTVGVPPVDPPLVAIYPREGTFWADHPYCVLGDPAYVTADQKQGAALFLAHLKGRAAQERALAFGFRPGDPNVAIAAPLDEAHGVDPKQPQTLLEVPPVPVLQALLETWGKVKKLSDVTLIFDKSGSMNGDPLREAKLGARAFLDDLAGRDDASLVFFDSQIYPPIGPLPIATGRGDLEARLDGTLAFGGTSLYDVVATSFEAAQARAAAEPHRIHALVVMTDGRDETSHLTLDGLRGKLPRGESASAVKIFTIGYGADADPAPLTAIAEAGDGSYSKGTSENIVQVYRDLASFF